MDYPLTQCHTCFLCVCRFAYAALRVGSDSITLKVFAVAFMAAPLVLVYGYIYKKASGLSWPQSFYKVGKALACASGMLSNISNISSPDLVPFPHLLHGAWPMWMFISDIRTK